MIFKTTRQADEDISALFVCGVLNVGDAQAEAYEAGLLRAFDLLPGNPLMACERPDLPPPDFIPNVRTRSSTPSGRITS